MKKKLFSVFLMCAVSVMFFSGCDYDFRDENWVDEIQLYFNALMINDSGLKNIDSVHKEVFDSALNDIEIFGTRLCVPMKVSELPDKFQLGDYSYTEYVSLSEKELYGRELCGDLKWYSLNLYYDKEVCVAGVSVICREDQSIEEGIIYAIYFDVAHYFQPILLGGKVEVRSGIDEIKEFFGYGNEFYETSRYSENEYCTVVYTDGNRIIKFWYSVQEDEMNFISGSVRVYNNYL